MRYAAILFLALSFMVSSCSYKEGYKEVKVNDDYTVSVPNYANETDELYNAEQAGGPDKATTQYSRAYRTVYFMVLEREKGNDFDAFVDMGLKELEARAAKFTPVLIDSSIIDSLPTQHYEITMMLDDEETYFNLAFIEGDKKYYRVMGWALTARNNFDQYQKDIRHFVNSFNEL